MDKQIFYEIRRLLFECENDGKVIDKILNSEYRKEDVFECVFNYQTNNKVKEAVINAYKNKEELNILNKQIEEKTSKDLSMDWEDTDINSSVEKVDNVYDGLVLSLSNRAKVDINYIAKVCNKEEDEVIKELKNVIYQNPETWNEDPYKGWETSDEYLSGSMFNKLSIAKEANKKYPGLFNKNIEAIKRIYPKLADKNEIYITLGSPWIPIEMIYDFIYHLLGMPDKSERKLEIKHDLYSGTWEVQNNNTYSTYNLRYNKTWGTRRCSALRIIENSLNMKKPFIYDTRNERDENGYYKEKAVLNTSETLLAQEKQNDVINEFEKWVWQDKKRETTLLKIYEEKYGSYIRRKYDGSFLTFPGMNKDYQLYDYQKNAVARMLFSKNTLLAHDVGSGKTYEMIAAGMELKRTGLSKKNLYVVPNNIVGQWERIFKELYIDSNVLVVEPKNFTKKKREETLKKIKENDYDAIIMAYSCFDMIPLSNSYKILCLKKRKVEILSSLSTYSSSVTLLNKRKEKIQKEITELVCEKKNEKYCFDNLGITRLFIDEVHNYKNITINTKMVNILGLTAKGSKKCDDMLDKVHFIQSINNGGGVVMATGTPITNSITEAYVIQQYLQQGELNLLDLNAFDSWAGMFAETVTDYEIDVVSNSYRLATRFSKFHNLPELTNLLSSIADFHKLDNNNNIPEFLGHKDIKIIKTNELQHVLTELSSRAEKVRARKVSRKEDNMLKITTDGRKAALDIRLYDKKINIKRNESKVYLCANNIYKEYIDGYNEKITQLVFCDSSTPKTGFNMYDELSRILIEKGIPAEEIAYIHDATSEAQRKELYKKVNKGEIRILIGSTFKLGIGVNVQERVKALHHLDIPWRPSDMTQREGRILRQGNLNKSINIYRYVTEGSFDAYSWQLLEIKQKFITDLLSGSLDYRDGEDIDSTALSYGEVKALAIGNPLIKKREEILNEISRLGLLRIKNISIREEEQKEFIDLPRRIQILNTTIEKATEDLEFINSLDLEAYIKEKESRTIFKKELTDALMNNILMPNERELFTLNGFKIVLPKDMPKDNPYINVCRAGIYTLEMSESENGNLRKLDNFFLGFRKILVQLKKNLILMENRKNGLEKELFNKDDVDERIKDLRKTLEQLNERLELKYEGQ